MHKAMPIVITMCLIIATGVGCSKDPNSPSPAGKVRKITTLNPTKPLETGRVILEGSLSKTALEDDNGTAVYMYSMTTDDGNKVDLTVNFESEQRTALVKAEKKKVKVQVFGDLIANAKDIQAAGGLPYRMEVQTVDILDPGIKVKILSAEPDEETGDGVAVKTNKGNFYLYLNSEIFVKGSAIIDKAIKDNREVVIFTEDDVYIKDIKLAN